MSGAGDWLSARSAGVPGALAEAMAGAVRKAAGEESVGATLASAALERLATVARPDAGRGTALDLLAADALLTAAFEAAAEGGPAEVEALGASLGMARFEALLVREGR